MGETLVLALLLALAAPDPPAAAPTPAAAVETAPDPQRVLGLIQARFRAHRPPPPFETYIVTRTQLARTGGLDEPNSYSKLVWMRNADRSALTRLMWSNGLGPLMFDRPAFNEARDPGPPTADLLEAASESDYRVDSLAVEGEQLHLRISPVRDAQRNRLREIFADRTSYELRKLIAMDKLYVDKGPVYPVTFTITMGNVAGFPVVTALHGVVGGNYDDDGREVDYTFTNIAFPSALPDWYFDSRTYGQHLRDAPH